MVDGVDVPCVLIVGASLSGAVLARVLAEGGVRCVVFEERAHVAGHCHTERDRETGVIVHRHGAHLLACFDKSLLLILHRQGGEYPHAYASGPYKYLADPPPLLLVARNNDQLN